MWTSAQPDRICPFCSNQTGSEFKQTAREDCWLLLMNSRGFVVGFYGKLCKMGEQCVKNHSQPPVRAIRNTRRLINARLTLFCFSSLMFPSHIILAHNIITDNSFFKQALYTTFLHLWHLIEELQKKAVTQDVTHIACSWMQTITSQYITYHAMPCI